MGDAEAGRVRLSFNPQLRVEFRGATVTSGAGLLLPASWTSASTDTRSGSSRPEAPDPACPVLHLQLAESYLTQRLVRQILGRIERLAWHPT